MDTQYSKDTTSTNLIGITYRTQGQPSGKPADFYKLVKQAGYVELDKATIATEGLSSYLPVGFSGDQLTSALRFFANGVSSEQLERGLDNKLPEYNLTERESQSLYSIPYLVSLFEETDSKLANDLQSTQQPTITVAPIPRSPTELVGLNIFQRDEQKGIFQPIIREIAGEGVDFAKNQLKDFAITALKKTGKKFATEAAEKLGKVALKGGAKLAAKAGVAAAAETAGAAAAPATGGLSLLVSAAIEVGQRAMKALKSLIPRKLKGWMQENKKYIAGASIVVFGMGLVFANPLFLLGGVGMGLIGWQLGGFIGLGAAIFAGLVAPFFTRLFGTMLATFAVIVLLTALCYLIITSGAYLTPYNPNAITTRGPQQSQFFTVSKLVEGQSYYQSQSADVTVTYTITISPLQGDLTNISFQSNCTVSQVTQTSQNCPTPTNITVNYGPNDGSFPPPVPTTIYASNPYNITYQRTFNSQTYNDSLITDIFTVSADVGAGIRSSGAGSASLALGNPPSDCPAGWPVRNVTRADGSQNYHMSQGPMGSFSHAGQEAVDIAPYPDSTHWDPNVDILYATHQGTVQTSSGTYGNWVRITGNCGAYGGSFSSLQGHLLSFLVSDGDIVNRGDPIGIMGNSGIVSTGAHVHYEFVNNPQIIMDNVQGQMFIPVSRQRILACTLFTCNLPIP